MAEYFFNDLRHRVLQSAMRKLEDLPQVTIAAINGRRGRRRAWRWRRSAICASPRTARASAKWPCHAGFVPESGGARNLPKLDRQSAGRCV